jgi:hypothetical protein
MLSRRFNDANVGPISRWWHHVDVGSCRQGPFDSDVALKMQIVRIYGSPKRQKGSLPSSRNRIHISIELLWKLEIFTDVFVILWLTARSFRFLYCPLGWKRFLITIFNLSRFLLVLSTLVERFRCSSKRQECYSSSVLQYFLNTWNWIQNSVLFVLYYCVLNFCSLV